MAKAMTLVGLDVHARQTHAAMLVVNTGELRSCRLRMAPEEVASFLAKLPAPVLAVYEAGPTGFGLARAAAERGIEVRVVAPGSIPKGPGDRVKTNRRDAVKLPKLLRAGELTAVWVPDERHEAMRDLVRARDAASKDYRIKRQNVSSRLLRLGRHYPGKKTWGRAHINWLTSLTLEHREQRRVGFDQLAVAADADDADRRALEDRAVVSLAPPQRLGDIRPPDELPDLDAGGRQHGHLVVEHAANLVAQELDDADHGAAFDQGKCDDGLQADHFGRVGAFVVVGGGEVLSRRHHT